MSEADWVVGLGIVKTLLAALTVHSLWYEAGVRKDKARAARENTPAE